MLDRWRSWLPAFLFGEPRPVVAVLRLVGPIGAAGRFRPGLNLAGVAKQIEQAFAVKGVTAVALAINSPGGSPVQSALIMKRIRDLAAEKDIPVLAFTEDIAASGGYMLALAGDEIFAHEASIVGSIGVISGGFGFPDALKKLGVERRLYTAGENKARLDPFSPEKEEDVAWLRDLQEEIHEIFKKLVRERRGRRLRGVRAKLFSGDVWIGAEAQKVGLIDGVGDMRAVLRERFGDKVRLRVVAQRRPRLASLFGMARDTDDDAAAIGWGPQLLAAIEARLMWSRFGL